MAVNWNWKDKRGEVIIKNELDDKKYKINIYIGNCLMVWIYDYKDEETKKNMYQFYSYFLDYNHLKNCLGMSKNYKDNILKNVCKIKLNTYYKDSLKIAALFAKSGIKVELYYKEIK